MPVTPLILGRGHSGQALAKSLALLGLIRPELEIRPAVWLERSCCLRAELEKQPQALLCIANPHALHAAALRAGDEAGARAILCEKPACVSLEQIRDLRGVRTPAAILHVYRQTWGMQTLRKMLLEGEFGEVLAMEGRYWQASAAERALRRDSTKNWKDDPQLSGASDTFLDVACHWVDAVSYLYGAAPQQIRGWRSFINAGSPHRDTHVQLAIDFPQGRAFGSISKTMHGAANHFEVIVVGSKLSATWQFLQPDEIQIGEGRDRRVLTRRDSALGSRQLPHHGMGWLEGYIEIASRLLDDSDGKPAGEFPRLSQALNVLEAMLKTEWRS